MLFHCITCNSLCSYANNHFADAALCAVHDNLLQYVGLERYYSGNMRFDLSPAVQLCSQTLAFSAEVAWLCMQGEFVPAEVAYLHMPMPRLHDGAYLIVQLRTCGMPWACGRHTHKHSIVGTIV